jgi:hypothetical protein
MTATDIRRKAARRMRIATTIGALVLVPQAVFADDACHRTADEKSVYMRALQTNLMVSALTCSISDQYNTFIHQFQPVLIKDAKQLTAYYKKRHGKAGATELNAFVTHLANDESERSIQEGQAQYCDEAAKLFAAVMALQSNQVEDFSTQMTISADAPVKPCAAAKTTQTAAVSVPLPASTTLPVTPGAAQNLPTTAVPVSATTVQHLPASSDGQ